LHTAAEVESYGAVNMTVNKWLQFPNHVLDAETNATRWSRAHTECITIQLDREIYCTTSNE
jgi:hypothetical protein